MHKASFCLLHLKRLAVFCTRCTSCALDVSVRNICARSQDSLPMCNICARLHKIILISPMRNIWARFAKDCTSSLMRNICARFAQDCTYFSKAQYMHKILLISPMHKICTRLHFFPQCAIYTQDLCKIVLILQCAIYMQDLRKTVLLSPMWKDCRHYWKKYVTFYISALNLEWYSLHSYFWIATDLDFFLNKHL